MKMNVYEKEEKYEQWILITSLLGNRSIDYFIGNPICLL